MVEPGAIAIRWPMQSIDDHAAGGHSPAPADHPPTLLEWYVRAGESIHKDQELLLVGRGTSLHPMTSPVDGTLLVQWSEAGEVVGAGETLGWIRPDQPQLDPS
ncbi:MAG TPA: hypothetical protein EYO84_12585 [Planctomycetes bacterium]|nr:hypothetical protein [Planctomycetota bacterium]